MCSKNFKCLSHAKFNILNLQLNKILSLEKNYDDKPLPPSLNNEKLPSFSKGGKISGPY